MRKNMLDLVRKYSPAYADWLAEKETIINSDFSFRSFYLAFSMASRVKGGDEVFSDVLNISQNDIRMKKWPVNRLGRIYLLLVLAEYDQEKFETAFQKLFETAELNELVALYASLPFLPNPERYIERAAEGIRTNIGPVLEAIAIRNPYPANHLPDGSWNQLVLKMVFTEKPFYQIVGLDRRANEPLAVMLINYAKERWAAGRAVTPELWRPVGKFLKEEDVWLLERMLKDDEPLQLEAALLACNDSKSDKLSQVLLSYPDIAAKIKAKTLTWDSLGKTYWEGKIK